MLNSAEKRELNELVKNATANLPLLIRIVAKPIVKITLKKVAKSGVASRVSQATKQFRGTPIYDGIKSRLSEYGIGQSTSRERSVGVGLEDDFP